MTTPVTTLDERYSDPAAVATEWDETRRALESAEVFWISTVRADGRPHVTPCVAVWLGGAVYFDTGVTQQKAVNLTANPHVELQDGPVRRDYQAREVQGAERDTWWDRAVAAYPDYAEYQKNTSRIIPVFVLTPADA